MRGAVIATSRGPLAPLWRALYRVAARAAGAWLARPGGVTVYLRERTEVVPGLSDLDLVLVTERPEGVPAATARLAQLQERLAPLGQPIEGIQVDSRAALERCARSSILTHGLREGRASRGLMIQGRPALGGQLSGLRRLAGPELLPPDSGPWPEPQRAGIAWLDMQFWWRQAFLLCAEPPRTWSALSGVKLIAEPLRTLLWLTGAPWHGRRDRILRAGLERFPAEEPALLHALDLWRGLPGEPEPDLGLVVGALGTWSASIAAETRRRAAEAGQVSVLLIGRADPGGPLPLADWPARVLEGRPDAQMVLAAGDPGDPGALRRCAEAWRPGYHTALRRADLIVLPTSSWLPALLRSTACPAFDPVSFALLDGESTARFPELAGLSAANCARRAVAEHSLRLPDPGHYPAEEGEGVARLLAAARAAMFMQSVEAGKPQLCVTFAEVAARVGGEDGLEALAAGRTGGEPTPASVLESLRATVRGLRPYAEAGTSRHTSAHG